MKRSCFALSILMASLSGSLLWVDAARSFNGATPAAVAAREAPPRPPRVEDDCGYAADYDYEVCSGRYALEQAVKEILSCQQDGSYECGSNSTCPYDACFETYSNASHPADLPHAAAAEESAAVVSDVSDEDADTTDPRYLSQYDRVYDCEVYGAEDALVSEAENHQEAGLADAAQHGANAELLTDGCTGIQDSELCNLPEEVQSYRDETYHTENYDYEAYSDDCPVLAESEVTSETEASDSEANVSSGFTYEYEYEYEYEYDYANDCENFECGDDGYAHVQEVAEAPAVEVAQSDATEAESDNYGYENYDYDVNSEAVETEESAEVAVSEELASDAVAQEDAAPVYQYEYEYDYSDEYENYDYDVDVAAEESAPASEDGQTVEEVAPEANPVESEAAAEAKPADEASDVAADTYEYEYDYEYQYEYEYEYEYKPQDAAAAAPAESVGESYEYDYEYDYDYDYDRSEPSAEVEANETEIAPMDDAVTPEVVAPASSANFRIVAAYLRDLLHSATTQCEPVRAALDAGFTIVTWSTGVDAALAVEAAAVEVADLPPAESFPLMKR